MMAEESSGERTEQATPRRRDEARKKGQIARSREIPSVMVLMTGLLVLFLSGSYLLRSLSELLLQSLNRMGSFLVDESNLRVLEMEVIRSIFFILGPILGAALVVSILSHYVQGGNIFSPGLVVPDLSKVSPVKGMGRLFSKQSLAELVKAVFKIVIIGWVTFSTIRNEWSNTLLLTGQDLRAILQYVSSVSFSLFLKAVLVMGVLAALDYFFQRWTHEKSLRMSKQELKEEFKHAEGDPLIRSRIRSLQREMARKRMMAEVPKADVIITNPEHLAVALRYKSGEMDAPRVVAKGAGWVAGRIKEIGRSFGIPIVENKPLARVLYKNVDLGQTIPSSLYHAVADILAYVYRIRNRKP
jgi:flagellar biosynthesis protein FlhB